MTEGKVPHLRVVVAVCVYVLAGWSAVSLWSLMGSDDKITQGNIVATWQNFAMLAVGFWLGSSSGGKANAIPSNTTVETRLVGQVEQTTSVGHSDPLVGGTSVHSDQGDEPQDGRTS